MYSRTRPLRNQESRNAAQMAPVSWLCGLQFEPSACATVIQPANNECGRDLPAVPARSGTSAKPSQNLCEFARIGFRTMAMRD
ncbi:hypothetical protein TNIN_442901 [Trichonephila inaurata madagascariensis]|uniref:Uncharacterized protein n=1 Tax=Trichonephila inaurata madagascariensis TaxID=2747483 RepID=A0A8X7BS64_9ARAC|nr:hypothetical protein TNIN_442901 [Trichonephila inaurata madagascariensis]